MIKINKKKQDAIQINESKRGDTFLYKDRLYLVIEDDERKFLNLDTYRIDSGLPLFADVLLVDCTLSYKMV